MVKEKSGRKKSDRLGVLVFLAFAFMAASPVFAESQAQPQSLTQESMGATEPSAIKQLSFEVESSGQAANAEAAGLRARSLTTSEVDIPVTLTEAQIKKSESAPWARMVWGGAVFILMLLVGWLVIKKFRFGNFSKKAAIPMRIVHQFHLAPKRSLVVVEVAGEYLLLGVTDHAVNLVKTLSLLDEDLAKNESSAVFEKVFDEKLSPSEDFEMGSPKEFLGLHKRQKTAGFVE